VLVKKQTRYSDSPVISMRGDVSAIHDMQLFLHDSGLNTSTRVENSRP